MKRLFIMRKDLNMSAGKLAAQVGHCAEAYWLDAFKYNCKPFDRYGFCDVYGFQGVISKDIYEGYVCGSITKVICQARNKNHLLKAKTMAEDMGLHEGTDFGLIYDNCLTELQPEEDDGTCLTGIWFCPLYDEEAEKISKNYHLYT